MSITNGPNLGAMIDAAAGDAHPNELRKLLRMLDCFLPNLSVKSRSVTAQPSNPADGDRYILAAAHTGTAWGPATAGQIAYYSTHQKPELMGNAGE